MNDINQNKIIIPVLSSLQRSKESVSTSTRIRAIIDKYKPFIPLQYHLYFDVFPSDDIAFTHYLVFAIWFCSQMDIPVNKMDFYTLHNSFKHLPFHSFLLHIPCKIRDF
jgi:hypothetical protein